MIWLSDFGTLSDGIHVYFSDVLLVMIDFQKKRGQWGDGGDVAENRHFTQNNRIAQIKIGGRYC